MFCISKLDDCIITWREILRGKNMALTLTGSNISAKKTSFSRFFNVKKLIISLLIIAILSALWVFLSINRIHQIESFNKAVTAGNPPQTDKQSFEAKYATALWLAKKERYKEATILFSALMPLANNDQKSALQYNLGNIFFLKGLKLNGTNGTVRNETEYLMSQAGIAYKQSVRFSNNHWDAKHNLDRILMILPGTPTPGVGESDDSPGLIMGNIPVGLP